ncbi:MAG TPA: hypothetical protein EYQ48_00960 [Candidatus Lambdaproteobacteria bacterium]|nr:hypothetical protein [Candidatus Lambdaproteobacteria bacterium]
MPRDNRPVDFSLPDDARYQKSISNYHRPEVKTPGGAAWGQNRFLDRQKESFFLLLIYLDLIHKLLQ